MKFPCRGREIPAPLSGEIAPTEVECGCGKVHESMSKLMSEILFRRLAREGECWHEFYERPMSSMYGCKKCDWLIPPRQAHHMDFFNPLDREWELFGWLWKRLNADGDVTFWEFERWLIRVGNTKSIISCVPLAEALYEWMKGQDG